MNEHLSKCPIASESALCSWTFHTELNSFHHHFMTSLVAQLVKSLLVMREIWIWSLGRKDPLEKEMATYPSIPAWRIPWTEEPGGLQSVGLQRVGHDWVINLHFHFHHHFQRDWRTISKFIKVRKQEFKMSCSYTKIIANQSSVGPLKKILSQTEKITPLRARNR